MKPIELIAEIAEHDHLAHQAYQAINDCHKLLCESGQLELTPPKSLVEMFKDLKTMKDEP